MAGGFDGDGRLDLDELGGVIDAPGGYRLGDASHEDVLGDDSRVSLGERLEAAGVLPWVRRHRVLLGAAAALVVGGSVAGTAYAGSRPPDVATVPDVELFSASPDGMVGYYGVGSQQLLQQAYRLAPGPTTATAVVDGVRGPGLRASQALTDVGAGVQAVAATVGCEDRALSAQPAQFRVHVTTTDLWGRTVAGWLEDPFSPFGWADQVRYACWAQMTGDLVRLSSLDAAPDLASSSVDLRIGIRNAMPLATMLGFDGLSWQDTAMRPGTLVPADARTDVEALAHLDVRDCADAPAMPDVSYPVPGRPDLWTGGPGIQVSINASDGQFGNAIPLTFDTAAQAEVRSALDAVCAGAPRARLARTTVGRVELLGTGATIPLVVDVDLPRGVSGRLTLADVGSGTVDETATAALPAGGGRATVAWSVTCSFAVAPPALELRASGPGGRSWPFQLDLPQELLAEAVVRACPELTTQRLVDEGGWVLDGVDPGYPSGG